jgi:putative tryptophan/tyrosine transport system substrate-binding protein
MRRRDFIALLGGAASLPLAARAQVSTKRQLVAILTAIGREGNAPLVAFERGMRELGYASGQNIDMEYRFADGKLDRFPMLAGELVRQS